MGRLAKTAIALVGLAAIGGFVSLLGGPNVFSTFSNAISTILPESELAVEETEEKQTQDEVPADPKPEERKELVAETKEPAKEEIVATKITETSQTVAAITKEPEAKPKAQSQVISPVAPSTPSPVLKPQAKRVATSASGGDRYAAPSRTQGSGPKVTGMWCGTSVKAFIMTEGDTCWGLRFNGYELVYP